jgi:hypothetical protein
VLGGALVQLCTSGTSSPATDAGQHDETAVRRPVAEEHLALQQLAASARQS